MAHFAALCSVNESMEQPEMYFENNVIGSFNLFEAMRKASVKNIIFLQLAPPMAKLNICLWTKNILKIQPIRMENQKC